MHWGRHDVDLSGSPGVIGLGRVTIRFPIG